MRIEFWAVGRGEYAIVGISRSGESLVAICDECHRQEALTDVNYFGPEAVCVTRKDLTAEGRQEFSPIERDAYVGFAAADAAENTKVYVEGELCRALRPTIPPRQVHEHIRAVNG